MDKAISDMHAGLKVSEAIAVRRDSQTRQFPENLQILNDISKNLWWSWTADGANIFRDLDSHLWESTEQNPIRVLREISELRLFQRANDTNFVERVKALGEDFKKYLAQSPKTYGDGKLSPKTPVAYFCAEYGIHNSLPLYSGGLGILAGDHLKSASDMNVPLIAIGLFYHYGYFRQMLSSDGLQLEHYNESVTSNLAIHPVLDSNGEHLKISVEMRGREVFAHIWCAQIGRIKLYLLDTQVAENAEIDRLITGYLYGGDRETRVVQEMMLGIGGVRLLRKLEITPSVYHLNEGHSAFLTLELAREFLTENETSTFYDAIKDVREKCVFTTHTPVAAGNESFEHNLIDKCFGENFADSLILTRDEFFTLGKKDITDEGEWFGVTPLSLRMCRSANGVSEKHGEVSRELWLKMFPKATQNSEVPISFVTNGVHAPTWIAPSLKTLYQKEIGENWEEILHDEQAWTEAVEKISDEALWNTHFLLKQQLIALVRQRTFQARSNVHQPSAHVEEAWSMFDAEYLTIGFARRVAGYKRWNLLLSQPERLLSLIDNAEKPVQFVFAGKAHPQDAGAKRILQQLIAQRSDSKWARRAIFLQDYDQEMAKYLVQGVDVWLNVPRRPLEASGTSGEKVAMNGGLNFSILDGWWIEGYNGKNGFGINGLGENDADFSDEEIDLQDANKLYETLENLIIPTYYDFNSAQISPKWIAMMRNSLQTLTPRFSSDRMLKDYIEQIYC